jgi:hypothetical protein
MQRDSLHGEGRRRGWGEVRWWGGLPGFSCGQRRGSEPGGLRRRARGVGLMAVVATADAFRGLPAWAQEGLKLVQAAAVLGALSFGGATCVRRWLEVGAGAKFRARAPLYMTIPLIAGLLNWATNQLAVWMIFNPLEFAGVPLVSRPRPGEPLGWGGWQGIVPAKVGKMASDIVDLTFSQLLDVKGMFAMIDDDVLLGHMQERGALLLAVAGAAEETEALPPLIVNEAQRRARGGEATAVSDVLEGLSARVVRRVLRGLKQEPLAYCPLKKAVVEDMAANKQLLCQLFQQCGKAELRFIVDMGLWGGLALGLVQMAFWLLWDPRWTLVAGGAAVGYVTNLVALKVSRVHILYRTYSKHNTTEHIL